MVFACSSAATVVSADGVVASRRHSGRDASGRSARPGPNRPVSAPKESKSRWVLAVGAVGVVALVASTAGVFLGNRITDWLNEPPSRASEEAINVAAPA